MAASGTPMPSWLGAAATTYLGELTSRLISVFGARLTGAWLLGSGAYGGFGHESDLDVQAATESEPTTGDVETLVGLITPDLRNCPAAGLELVLYDRAVLADPTPPLRWSLNLNGGAGRPISVSTDPVTEPWHWFVLDVAVARHHSVTLHGADFSDVAGEVGGDLQLEAIAESMRWHRRDEPESNNHLANAARALRYVETGVWGSKPAALGWLTGTDRTPGDAIEALEQRFGLSGQTAS